MEGKGWRPSSIGSSGRLFVLPLAGELVLVTPSDGCQLLEEVGTAPAMLVLSDGAAASPEVD